MWAGYDYSDAQPGDSEPFGIDITKHLPGFMITSAVVTLVLLKGTDPTPNSHVVGAVSIDVSGRKASQVIEHTLVDCDYAVNWALTNQDGKTRNVWLRLSCRNPS